MEKKLKKKLKEMEMVQINEAVSLVESKYWLAQSKREEGEREWVTITLRELSLLRETFRTLGVS